MKKINIFPKTVIQTNGVHPYVLKTVARDNSLKLIEIESKDDSAINVDLSDIVFDGVAIKAYSELGETTLRWVRQCRATQNFVTVQNRPLECDDTLKVEYMSELEFLVSKGYTIVGGLLYEVYYDAARWASQTDTNSLSTDGKVETQDQEHFYKYRLRRKDGQSIDPVELVDFDVYVESERFGFVKLEVGHVVRGVIRDTEYGISGMYVIINEDISTEGVINLTIAGNSSSHLIDDRYTLITGFLRIQIRERNSIIAEYNVLIDTARQNVIDTLALSGPTSITSTTPATYTLSETWINDNPHKYKNIQISYSPSVYHPGHISVSWIVPGETFQLTVPQDYTDHNATLYVFDEYQNVIDDNRPCRSNTLTIDIDVPSENITWTDVSSEWTINNILNGIGYRFWTDNLGNYYYGSDTEIYKIDEANKAITLMTGWTGRNGGDFWRIENTVLCNDSVWNPDNTVTPVTWSGLQYSASYRAWTDGTSIYCYTSGDHYMLTYFDPVNHTGTWTLVTFTGTPYNFNPRNIWTDGTDVYYYKSASEHFILDKSTRTWTAIVINIDNAGVIDVDRMFTNNGSNIYMYDSSSATGCLYKLEKSGSNRNFKLISSQTEVNDVDYMISSRFIVSPKCQLRGVPSAIGNIDMNTDNIYYIRYEAQQGAEVERMDK